MRPISLTYAVQEPRGKSTNYSHWESIFYGYIILVSTVNLILIRHRLRKNCVVCGYDEAFSMQLLEKNIYWKTYFGLCWNMILYYLFNLNFFFIRPLCIFLFFNIHCQFWFVMYPVLCIHMLCIQNLWPEIAGWSRKSQFVWGRERASKNYRSLSIVLVLTINP